MRSDYYDDNFNAISSYFFTKGYQSSGVRLGSNRISVTVDDGAVVGVLSTISSNPEETFAYQLLEEAEQPFGIIGNKVVVVRRKGQEFQVPSPDELYFRILITIISSGSLGSSFEAMFLITIMSKWNIVGIVFCVSMCCEALRLIFYVHSHQKPINIKLCCHHNRCLLSLTQFLLFFCVLFCIGFIILLYRSTVIFKLRDNI